MNQIKLFRTALFLALGAFATASAFADIVETKNGARIVGKITSIDGGKVAVTTEYAGDLTIKQSEVTVITTDAPLNIRLASGTTLQGVVSA